MPRIPTLFDTIEAISDMCGLPPNNTVTYEEGYYVSYLPYANDTQSDETAIVIKDGDKLYGERMLILYGNHRQQLHGKSLSGAIAYWRANPELWGATSDRDI